MAFRYNIIRMFEEERAAARSEGKAEDIFELLEDIGVVCEELKKRIFGETDLEVLKRWHKAAARAKSIEEFEERTGIFECNSCQNDNH